MTAVRRTMIVFFGFVAVVAVWPGCIGLAQLSGFKVVHPLPGVWDSLQLDTAVVLPVSAVAYAACALSMWLSIEARAARTRRYAAFSVFVSLVIIAATHVAYYLMTAAGYVQAPGPLAKLVALMPVMLLGLTLMVAKSVSNDLRAAKTETARLMKQLLTVTWSSCPSFLSKRGQEDEHGQDRWS
jgi:hypothetical protein